MYNNLNSECAVRNNEQTHDPQTQASLLSRLPVELLWNILNCIVPTDTEFQQDPKQGTLNRLRITHVSHDLRQVALARPTLWTHIWISPCNPAAVSEILQRSKSTPLFVTADIPNLTSQTVQNLHLCMTKITRIRVLNIVADARVLQTTLRGVDWSNCHLLESLSISTSEQTYYTTPLTFHQESKRLRNISLVNCQLDWPGSSSLRDLTRLEIRHATPNTTPRSPLLLNAVLTLLHHSPTLEILRLDHVPIPSCTDDSIRPLTIPLPHLTHLHLGGNAAHTAHLIRQLYFTNNVKLKLTVRQTFQTDSFEDLFPVLRSKYDGQTWDRVQIGNDEDSAVTIQVWGTDSDDDEPGVDLCLRISESAAAIRLVPRACEMLGLWQVPTVLFGDTVTGRDVQDVLRPFSMVEMLSLPGPHSVVDALLKDVREDDSYARRMLRKFQFARGLMGWV